MTPVPGSILPSAGPPSPFLRNQTKPSRPAAMPSIDSPATSPLLNSVMTPAGVMRPIAGAAPPIVLSANQTLPSGPPEITRARPCSGPNSVTVFVVTSYRPRRLASYSVNHTLPSGPVATAKACDPGVMPLHVVVTKPLLAAAGAAVQAATPIGASVVVLQVVEMKLLPALPADSVQAATAVGPVVTVLQVVTPRLTVQVPAGTGVQAAVAVTHDWSCDVLRLTCDVVSIKGVGNSLATPVVTSIVPMLPLRLMPATGSANQRFPSGPLAKGPVANGPSPGAGVTG